jgi:drug/metabolite transporter (DMT)-like permease
VLLLVAGAQAASASAPDPVRGNLVAAVGGLAWALTLLGFRWVGRDGGDRGAMLLAGNLIAGALCLPLALPLLQASATDWAVIAWLGVFQIAVAYLLVSAGLRHLTAFEGVLLMLLEPVLNPVWAALIQGELPGLLPLAGGAVILAATTWRSLRTP